ncbi:hypothetical protein EBB07_06910 [Paenibacillaceae bacterium]|nr:hypothetical protein EBB07_06910 [Paenibacillaceae bacterium]
MSLWKGAWHIFRFEMRNSVFGLIGSFILITYLVFITGSLLNGTLNGNDQGNFFGVIDFLYFCIIPIMGFLITRGYLRTGGTDLVAAKIMAWRLLPITWNHIIAARLLQLIVISFFGQIYFFGLQYILLDAAQSITLLQYICFALFWYGYALVIGVTYIYWELGFNGRQYMIASIAYIAVYAATAFTLYLLNIATVQNLINAARQGQWLPTVAALVAAVIIMPLGGRIIKARLKKRSFFHT